MRCVICFSRTMVAALAVLAISWSAARAQGFASFWKSNKIELQRRLPPLIDMSGKTVKVEAQASQDGACPGACEELQGSIESLLTGSDSTVHVQQNGPDVDVAFAITRYKAPTYAENHDGNTTTRYITGLMVASFKVTEPQTTHLVASGVALYEVNEVVGTTGGSILDRVPHMGGNHAKASPMEAEKTLYSEVGRQIAAFLVKTTESVPAQIAVGKELDAPRKLAENKLWTRYLEALETMTPNPDPRLDVYRQYDIGLAHEALAYQSSDPKAALTHLQEASIKYGKAIDTRPDEKGFLEPQTRIKEALAHYSAPPPPPPPTAVELEKAAGILTDDEVIEMVKAKMDDATIVDNIQSAEKVHFDLSIDAQVKMSKAGVSGKVIALMKQKVKTSGVKK